MSKVCQRLVSIILAGADRTFLPAGECRDNFTVAVNLYVKMLRSQNVLVTSEIAKH